jgi:hypothetical protein
MKQTTKQLKKSETVRDHRHLFDDREGEFLASSVGEGKRLELPGEVLELLGTGTSSTEVKKQTFVFYRYEGHVCLSTPQTLRSTKQAPVFRTESGEFNRKAFCSVLAVTERELDDILASPKASYHDEPEHTLETLQTLLEQAGDCFHDWKTTTTWLNSPAWGLDWETHVAYLKQGKWSRVRSIVGTILYGGAA